MQEVCELALLDPANNDNFFAFRNFCAKSRVKKGAWVGVGGGWEPCTQLHVAMQPNEQLSLIGEPETSWLAQPRVS